jgi:hypothetical protein
MNYAKLWDRELFHLTLDDEGGQLPEEELKARLDALSGV